jgi:PAS domain S-box-containing protein
MESSRLATRGAAPLIVAAIATLLGAIDASASARGVNGAGSLASRSTEAAVTWTVAAILAGLGRRQEASIAERKQATRAMADSLRGLDEIRYALDQAAIVAATDHRGVITYVNDKFCEISKYSRDELLGRDHRIISSAHHPKEFIDDLWRTIGSGRVWRGELRNRAKDGSFYWVDTTIVPFLDGNGQPWQYLSIRCDITARKNAEAQIREEAAFTHLGKLAAVVAHEVRNPLAGLRASLQILGRRPDGPDREIVAAMIQRIDELNDKVEDLLLYARHKPPRRHPVDVRAVIQDVAVSARVATGNAGPPVGVTGGDGIKAYADPYMLRAALLNVTMNACQAAGAREVDIRIAGERGLCRIAVNDRGPGIPPEVRDRVFEPFFTTRAGGTGLGLAIVKRLLELQDGGIVLRDRPEGGTVAEVTVPLAPM